MTRDDLDIIPLRGVTPRGICELLWRVDVKRPTGAALVLLRALHFGAVGLVLLLLWL